MRPFEVVSAGTSLIGTKTFDSLGLVGFGKKARRRDAIVQFPVHERHRRDCYHTDEEEDAVGGQFPFPSRVT